MRIRAASAAALAVVAALLMLLACTTTSHSTSCSGGTCVVKLTGEQTLDVGAAEERPLKVGPIEADAVMVASAGEQAKITVGQTGTVNGMIVRMVSVSGRDVALEIRFT